MLRVSKPEKTVKFCQKAFGLELREKKQMDTFDLYFLGCPDQTVELEPAYNRRKDDRY